MPQPPKKPSYNESQSDLQTAKRKAERDLTIPPVFDPKRRAACEADDEEWLRVYCEEVFYNPFTTHQKKIIADCGESLRFGTRKCKAAPRGDGKSSIVKYLALKYVLAKQVRFPLIVAATSSKAKLALESIQRRLAQRAVCPITQDYPLECHVARYVDPWPSRARNVTANGQRKIHVEWGSNHIILPTWEDEEPLGPIIYSLGITSDDLQGCNVYDQRPDFVMLDDLDSRDSLASEDGVVAEKIEDAIDKTIAGMGGQSRRLGQFMLCTITSRKSAAFKYSNPSIKPSFSGERIPAIIKWPERLDLWDTYIELRQNGQRDLDEAGKPRDVFGREAHRHYEVNLEAMDAGVELSNPHNFTKDELPDGTPTHLSSLQRCYDYISDTGMNSFLTEHQNDPPEETGPMESGITPHRIQRQLSGLERGEIPEGCEIITRGVDVRKVALHWVVRAWKPYLGSVVGYTIDYGVYEIHGTKYGSDEGADVAIRRGILNYIEETKEKYGQPIDLTLIDAGYKTDAVYSACLQAAAGGESIMPVMGYGRSAGCIRANFYDVQKNTRDRKPGDGWFISRQGNIWLANADADRWKGWEHERWMTAPDKPGSMLLFGTAGEPGTRLTEDEKGHHSYSHHICSENEVEEMYQGTLRRKWRNKSDNNHWLDASYYCDVAANMRGIRLDGLLAAKPTKRIPGSTMTGKPKMSLAEMAAAARR